MKYYILLILLVTHTVLCYSQNNTINAKWKDSIQTQLYNQLQRLDKYEANIEGKAKNLEEKLNMRNEYVDYKKEHVSWWLNIVGLLVAIFGVLIPAVGFFYGRKLYLDINNQKKIVNDEINKLKCDAIEAKKLFDDAQKIVDNLKSFEIEGKKHTENIKSELNLIRTYISNNENNDEKLFLNEVIHKAKEIANEKDTPLYEKYVATLYEKYLSKNYLEVIEIGTKIIDMFDNVISKESKSEIFFIIAHSYQQIDKYKHAYQEKALEHYNKCIDLEPNRVFAYNNRGIIYFIRKEYELAKNDYNKAILLAPEYAMAYNNRGNLHSLFFNYTLAIKDYLKVIDLSKGENLNAPNGNISEAYFLIGQYELARQYIDKLDNKDLPSYIIINALLDIVNNKNIDIENVAKKVIDAISVNYGTWTFAQMNAWLTSNYSSHLSNIHRQHINKLIEIVCDAKPEVLDM